MSPRYQTYHVHLVSEDLQTQTYHQVLASSVKEAVRLAQLRETLVKN